MKLTRLGAALAAGAVAVGAIAAAQAATNETIVTVVKVTGINWFNRMDDGVKEFAKENTGITAYQTGPGRADAAQQLKIIEDLIAKKVTAIAVVPYDPPTLEPALKKAMDRGIKVVTHEADNAKNTMVDIEAFDNTAYGAGLNERLASCMHNEGKWAVLVGSLGSRSQVQWADGGIGNAKAKYAKMNLVEPKLETNNDGERAYEVAKEVLRKHPDLKGFQGSSAVSGSVAMITIRSSGSLTWARSRVMSQSRSRAVGNGWRRSSVWSLLEQWVYKPSPLDNMKLKLPCRAMVAVSSATRGAISSQVGARCRLPNVVLSSCKIQQNAFSLSVDPIGR